MPPGKGTFRMNVVPSPTSRQGARRAGRVPRALLRALVMLPARVLGGGSRA